MDFSEIENNVKRLKDEISAGNAYGEAVTLVAATKTQSAEAINAAIRAGVDAVAENKVQEFREKFEAVHGCPQHFIGHLQTNKVKYLVGKITLFHSCDRDELAEEIARLSLKRNVVSQILVQVNIGREETKGGYAPENAFEAYRKLKETAGLKVRGFMAMRRFGRRKIARRAGGRNAFALRTRKGGRSRNRLSVAGNERRL